MRRRAAEGPVAARSSTPKEEGPPSDEQMPSEPKPQSEQHEAPGGYRHEGAKQVRERWPFGSAEKPDALPDEKRPDDPEPPEERDRAHFPHLTIRISVPCQAYGGSRRGLLTLGDRANPPPARFRISASEAEDRGAFGNGKAPRPRTRLESGWHRSSRFRSSSRGSSSTGDRLVIQTSSWSSRRRRRRRTRST